MSSWSGWFPGSGMGMFASDQDIWGMRPPPIWRIDGEDRTRPVEEERFRPKSSGEGRESSLPQQPRKRGHDDDDEDDEYDSKFRGSKANASFNAWFPIVLGMYPEEGSTRSRAEWKGAEERGVAAVANSVNHGRSGVASSHAIVYSGEPPARRKAPYDVTKPAE